MSDEEHDCKYLRAGQAAIDSLVVAIRSQITAPYPTTFRRSQVSGLRAALASISGLTDTDISELVRFNVSEFITTSTEEEY